MIRQTTASEHYDAAYFDWQSWMGDFGAKADLFKFRPYVSRQDRVIDFGCGGGFILRSLDCAERLGVELNPSARAHCTAAGVPCVPTLAEVDDGWADVVISHHALEHVTDPFAALCAVREKLRPGGRAVFVTPCEGYRTAYRPDDINNHLFTWSPLNLGNLFKAAGFEVQAAERMLHRWPPKAQAVQRLVGWSLFDKLSHLRGFLDRRAAQVRVVASRPG